MRGADSKLAAAGTHKACVPWMRQQLPETTRTARGGAAAEDGVLGGLVFGCFSGPSLPNTQRSQEVWRQTKYDGLESSQGLETNSGNRRAGLVGGLFLSTATMLDVAGKTKGLES